MGAACVTHPKDQDEIIRVNMEECKSRKDELRPTSSIRLLFEVMSEEIGYETVALQDYCDKLLSLWIYRVIDVLNIDEDTWNELEIPSVLEHVIKDYLNELKNTDTFSSYAHQSHTDIYVTFINKDIRTLFKQLLKSVNDLESAKQHIIYLQNVLNERYLLNTDKLKKYMTKQEWIDINVPTNLKKIICNKINFSFDNDGEHKQYQESDERTPSNDKDEGQGELDIQVTTSEEEEIQLVTSGGGVMPGLHNMSSIISSKIHSLYAVHDHSEDDKEDTFNDIVFDDKIEINKSINAQYNMMEIAEYFSKILFVDDVDKVYDHFKYFVEYGYHTLYHLSFISNALFDRLLFIKNTPKCIKCELFELIAFVREKYTDSIHTISHILPFNSNLYWEKTTNDAFTMLQYDINLNLETECNILMNNFYSNMWDLQFISNDILTQLNAYRKYEIVRIRMQHMIKLCQYHYGQQYIPLLPPIWKVKYDANLLIHDVFDDRSTGFHFDGFQWNEITKHKAQLLLQYLDDNFVRKIQFLPIQHRKNEKIWTEFMNQNNISPHLRFKINFYAIHGLPNSDDIWINNYIQDNYKKMLPQYEQSLNLDIITKNAKEIYNDIKDKVICIENMLHFIHEFNNIYIGYYNKAEIVEMNEMIQNTITEIDEMGLNQEFYQIIQLCGTKSLNKLKKKKKLELLLDGNNIDLNEFDETKCNELSQINDLLLQMKQKIYSIPIEDIVALSQTICGSVEWLKNEINGSTKH